MQLLVEQIRAQVLQPAGQQAGGVSSTQLDDISGTQDLPLGVGEAGGLAPGAHLEVAKKEGRPGKQRPAPYPAVQAAAKEEQQATQPPASSGRDLGLEGPSADEFDSLLDGGQQVL